MSPCSFSLSRETKSPTGDESFLHPQATYRESSTLFFLQVLPFLLLFFFSLPRLIPPEIGHRRSKSTGNDRFRVVTGRKQPQLAIPPDSGQSTYRSAGRPVRTAHTRWYDLISRTLGGSPTNQFDLD
ncbi:hypothetical protein BHE74_00015734 [Ensete ventricosum]|uniref:Uncharacterized protein n=1 Tax=Ensete ventricosum TaxID=4639 RepID=A0A444DLW6_ENSVE|nr:hypothetical protein GW17_00038009 [Ensete ventricosum]RWW76183.1 hypothetical protein BHE74_00015734 [Ensete ventricosum]RZR71733.1 hypothetical protein BHM03_00006937 [Ensete ventricosum]